MANIFHIERAANKITLGTTGTTINIASHTASRLLGLDANKNLESVSNIIMPDGSTIGQAAGPLLTFDDTNNFLEITGCKVGIGVSDPTYHLELKAVDQTIFSINSTGSAYSSELYFLNDSTFYGGIGAYNATYDPTVGNGLGLTSGLNNDGFIFFRTKTGGTYQNRLWILNNGNVGIGVTDPHSKLEVNGAISSGTLTVTASADNLDVSGVNTVFINITENIVLGGLTGGVDGQSIEFVYKGNYTNTVTFEDTEGVGDQDFYMHTRADEVFDGGGITFSCDGSNWYDGGHGRHV